MRERRPLPPRAAVRRRRGRAALGLALALACGPALAAEDDQKLRAGVILEPAIAGLDELVTLSITVEASGFGGLQIQPEFELENLEIVAGPFQSRSQRWVNGETSNSVALTWRLRAKAVGSAAVGSLRITAGEARLELGEKRIEVQAAAPPGRAQPAPSRRSDPFEDLFGRAYPEARGGRRAPARAPKIRLRAEVSPAELYVGQQATYTLWLYTQSDISAFQPTRIPDFRGFWVREIPQPQDLKPEWVEEGGERFGRVPMLRRALYPLAPGTHTIEPTEVDVVARMADFGPFGSPFGRNEGLHLTTEPAKLTARELPATSTDFHGPVGEVALSARLDRSTLDVGQAATLTVRCTGRGNLQSLAAPQLDLPEGLRAFPPKQDQSERVADGLLVTSAEWTFVLVPERPGRFELAAVSVPYFDPARREYRAATATPAPLVVRGTALAAPPTPEAGSAAQSEAKPDGPATDEGEELSGWASSLSRNRGWLMAGGGLVVAGIAGLEWARRRRSQPSGSASALRSAIAEAASAGSPRQAAAELEDAWRRHLAERWQIAPGTPVSSWTERLITARADAGAAQALTELAHELHYLRYAPELSAADHLLAEALARSRRLTRALR